MSDRWAFYDPPVAYQSAPTLPASHPDVIEGKALLASLPDEWDETKGLSEDERLEAMVTDRLRSRWEATVDNAIARHWIRRRTILLSKLRSAQFRKGTPLWDPPGTTPLAERLGLLVDLKQWDKELTDELKLVFKDLHQEAVGQLQAESKADFPGFIMRWIERSLRFNRTVRGAVQQVLNAEPTRVEDLEDAVNTRVEDVASRARSVTAIALSTGAVNESQYEAARTAGVVDKIWFTAQDSRVRPQHRHVNLQRVPLDQPFRVRDRRGDVHDMMYPGDPSAPPDLWMNCRCVMLLATPTSQRLWEQTDGSILDPYGRGSLVGAKGVDPAQLGLTWATG